MIGQFSSKILFLICLPFFIFAAVPTDNPTEASSEASQENVKAPWLIFAIPADASSITLSDGTTYEISHPHRQVVARWSDGRTHPGDVIVVNTKNNNIDYPIDIYNKHTGETVQARYPKTVEELPSEEAPSEDDESD